MLAIQLILRTFMILVFATVVSSSHDHTHKAALPKFGRNFLQPCNPRDPCSPGLVCTAPPPNSNLPIATHNANHNQDHDHRRRGSISTPPSKTICLKALSPGARCDTVDVAIEYSCSAGYECLIDRSKPGMMRCKRKVNNVEVKPTAVAGLRAGGRGKKAAGHRGRERGPSRANAGHVGQHQEPQIVLKKHDEEGEDGGRRLNIADHSSGGHDKVVDIFMMDKFSYGSRFNGSWWRR
ncbi:hypothetical protein HDU76_002100 [Blyttiomyces sp. JEL0837]|nr:hypothetical protein HDU76_002100 [Blyttiomyces sp. JEL0837]